jgi:hypothetical protein
MGPRLGLDPWRWLFIIEGSISLFFSFVSYFSLPSRAEKAWFLSPTEAECMRKIKERDAIFSGQEHMSKRHVWMALRDPLVYLSAIALFSSSLPLLSFGTFLPTIISGFGYV